MRLEVVTPKGMLVQAEADEVTAPGTLGEFGVLQGHLPLLTGLRPGVLSWRHGGEASSVAVSTGFAQVIDDRVVVMAESGQLAEQIDAAAVRAELDDVTARLDQAGDDEALRLSLDTERQWALARLSAAGSNPAAAH
jgi:F-type H+-transporting ATPase subunit epsilon